MPLASEWARLRHTVLDVQDEGATRLRGPEHLPRMRKKPLDVAVRVNAAVCASVGYGGDMKNKSTLASGSAGSQSVASPHVAPSRSSRASAASGPRGGRGADGRTSTQSSIEGWLDSGAGLRGMSAHLRLPACPSESPHQAGRRCRCSDAERRSRWADLVVALRQAGLPLLNAEAGGLRRRTVPFLLSALAG
jgi:hypothetical protein